MPAPPRDVRARVTEGGMVVSWAPPEGFVQSFIVEVIDGEQSIVKVRAFDCDAIARTIFVIVQEATVSSDVREHTFPSLRNLTTFDVRVFSSIVTVEGKSQRSLLQDSDQEEEELDPDFIDKCELSRALS